MQPVLPTGLAIMRMDSRISSGLFSSWASSGLRSLSCTFGVGRGVLACQGSQSGVRCFGRVHTMGNAAGNISKPATRCSCPVFNTVFQLTYDVHVGRTAHLAYARVGLHDGPHQLGVVHHLHMRAAAQCHKGYQQPQLWGLGRRHETAEQHSVGCSAWVAKYTLRAYRLHHGVVGHLRHHGFGAAHQRACSSTSASSEAALRDVSTQPRLQKQTKGATEQQAAGSTAESSWPTPGQAVPPALRVLTAAAAAGAAPPSEEGPEELAPPTLEDLSAPRANRSGGMVA